MEASISVLANFDSSGSIACLVSSGSTVAGLVPVHVLANPNPEPAAAHVLEVVLADGRRLRVPAGFDAVTLRHVLAVLEETSPC